MSAPNSKFNIIIIGSSVVMAIIVFALIWLVNRNKPFLTTIIWYVVVLAFLGIIAGIIFLIVWLFRRHKIDLLFVMKNQIHDSCKINAPIEKVPIMLYDNKNTNFLGFFEGFTIIKTANWMSFLDNKDENERNFYQKLLKTEAEKKEAKEENIYIISFKAKSGKSELLLALEGDFNDLNANPIILYGMGLSPKLYEFLFLSKHYDIGQNLELPVKNLVNKYALEHMMREQVNIIDNAIDIDAQFRKNQEKSNIDDFRGDKKE